uniref:Guanylate cyclase activator 2B n=1 Tax=Pogona vitticeps TaxID=103695 RepID=A0A6J0V591_9SAUR
MASMVIPVMLIFSMVVQTCRSAVMVQDGGLAFPLESVKKLKVLLEADAGSAPSRQRSQLPLIAVCKNPELPKEFTPVCRRRDAPLVFKRLNLAVSDDLCEICANAACTGCY